MTDLEPEDDGPVPITDDCGRFVWHEHTDDITEPEPGSVILMGGAWGTAWQRWYIDGLWHSTRDKGGPKTWEWLLRTRNIVLAYDAEPRPEGWVYAPRNTPSLLTGADLLDEADLLDKIAREQL